MKTAEGSKSTARFEIFEGNYFKDFFTTDLKFSPVLRLLNPGLDIFRGIWSSLRPGWPGSCNLLFLLQMKASKETLTIKKIFSSN